MGVAGGHCQPIGVANGVAGDDLHAHVQIADHLLDHLELLVVLDSEVGVVGIEDFADETLLIGLCAQAVPCGALARNILLDAGIETAIDTSEPDVRSLLTKLEAGELDAGIVYLTDVIASEEVTGIEIPDDLDLVTDYLIAVVADAPNPTGAEDFVAFVLSAEGQQILATHGFTAP